LPSEVRIDKYGQYKVYLFHTYEKKILAIKIVREFNSLGLREAKDKVDASPVKVLIAENLSYDEAQEILKKIRLQKMDGEIEG
jgi:ribosomal protein L7/L12